MKNRKYSILLPYYNRPEFRNTLASYVNFYNYRDDYEVIIVEDIKNKEDKCMHEDLLDIMEDYRYKVRMKYDTQVIHTYSPSLAYNKAAKLAEGDILVISNPECVHTLDILKEVDSLYDRYEDAYIVCACKNVNYSSIQDNYDINIYSDCSHIHTWFQHSVHNNRLLNFTSFIKKQDYKTIDGFDEIYINGLGYEDNDFLAKVKQLQIPILTYDNLLVLHQAHNRLYQENRGDLVDLNRDIFHGKWCRS